MTNKWKRKKGEAEINAQDKNVMHEIAQFMEEYKPELQKKLRKHGQKELYEKLVIRIDSQIDALRSQAAQRAAGFAKL